MNFARPRSLFFVVMALVMLAIVVTAFTPSLYLRSAFGTTDYLGNPSLLPHLVVHGVVLTAWYVLFLVQPGLVAASRTGTHRRLGVAGAGLAAAVVVSGVLTTVHAVPRFIEGGFDVAGDVAPVVVGNFVSLAVFTVFVAAAVYFRKRPATHKRLMLLASVIIIGPAFSTARPVGRALMPYVPEAVVILTFTLACLGALAWHDFASNRRLEPATLWGTLVIAIGIVVMGALLASGAGTTFTLWFA